MAEPLLIREELVELSVMRALKVGLPDYGYAFGSDPASANVNFREAFPTADERNQELQITTLAFGFNIDDGGEPGEMGSTLTKFVHSLICWTFATEPRFGRRLAHTIKRVARRNLDMIALLDFNEDPPVQIDSMNVMKTQVRHEVNQSPRPWDQYVWTTHIAVLDSDYMT